MTTAIAKSKYVFYDAPDGSPIQTQNAYNPLLQTDGFYSLTWQKFSVIRPIEDKKIWFRRQNSQTELSGQYLGLSIHNEPCVRSLNNRIVVLGDVTYEWKSFEAVIRK